MWQNTFLKTKESLTELSLLVEINVYCDLFAMQIMISTNSSGSLFWTIVPRGFWLMHFITGNAIST
jgi:hypothetical protein